MVLWLKSGGADFEDRFKALLGLKREQSADVNDKAAAIIARVREEGDAALIDLTKTYDGVDLRSRKSPRRRPCLGFVGHV